MTRILALSGKKQAGKTSAMSYLFGVAMTSVKLPDGGPLIPYFKVSKDGRLITPANDQPEIYDTETGEWQPKPEGTVGEGYFEPCSKNYAVQDWLIETGVWRMCHVYSFADHLKNICIDVLGLKWEQCWGSDADKNSDTHLLWQDMPSKMKKSKGRLGEYKPKDSGVMTAREVMQYLGTNIFREMYDNVWVDATIRRIMEEQSQLAIIPDCRFPNEVLGVQAAGGKVVRLTRNPHPEDNHPSETALDDYIGFDAVIDNANMSIAEQNEELAKLMMEWGWMEAQ